MPKRYTGERTADDRWRSGYEATTNRWTDDELSSMTDEELEALPLDFGYRTEPLVRGSNVTSPESRLDDPSAEDIFRFMNNTGPENEFVVVTVGARSGQFAQACMSADGFTLDRHDGVQLESVTGIHREAAHELLCRWLDGKSWPVKLVPVPESTYSDPVVVLDTDRPSPGYPRAITRNETGVFQVMTPPDPHLP